MPDITLRQGTIHYRDGGNGAPLVFILDGTLCDPVVERLVGSARGIVPDLPCRRDPRRAHVISWDQPDRPS